MAAFSRAFINIRGRGRESVCEGGSLRKKKIVRYISGQIYWRLCAVNVAGALRLLVNSGVPPPPPNLDSLPLEISLVGEKRHTHTQAAHSVKVAETLQELLWMFSVLSGHSVQPLTDSGHKMMDGSCAALPAAENHLADLRPDLENRLRPRSRPVSHIFFLNLSNDCKRSSTSCCLGNRALSARPHRSTSGRGKHEPPAQP